MSDSGNPIGSKFNQGNYTTGHGPVHKDAKGVSSGFNIPTGHGPVVQSPTWKNPTWSIPLEDTYLSQLKQALKDGAQLNLLLLLVGKANIDQKQTNLKKLQDQLQDLQNKIKEVNTKNSQIQTWIQEHSKGDKWKKEKAPSVGDVANIMHQYGGYSYSETGKMNDKGQAQNMSNALTNTAKALDQEAQRITTKASQATQEFNSFVDVISSALKADIDAYKKTVSAY